MIVPVTEEKQRAGHQQRTAHHKGIGAESLDRIFDRYKCKQRKRTDNQQQNHTPVRRHGGRRAPFGNIADSQKKLTDHIHNIGPIGNKHSDQCTEMQQHIKGAVSTALNFQPQQILRNCQMSGTGNW